jgi:hypothetical protein
LAAATVTKQSINTTTLRLNSRDTDRTETARVSISGS